MHADARIVMLIARGIESSIIAALPGTPPLARPLVFLLFVLSSTLSQPVGPLYEHFAGGVSLIT